MKQMGKKNYFLLALAFMAFAACTNDIVVDGDHDIQNETAWISLGVRKPTTRALNNPDEHNGTGDESIINSVKLLFFNGHMDESVLTDEIDFSTANIGDVTGQTKAFRVSKSAKSVLVIANPANLPTLSVGATTYKEVNNVVADNDAEASVMGGGNSFMMTNAKGGLEPSVMGSGAPVGLTLYPTESEAESNVLNIYVDRLVAKVRVEAATTSDVASISDVEWVLNVKNKKYIPVSKRVKTYFNTPTPHDIYSLGSYRIDPNYDNTEGASWKWQDGVIPSLQTNYNKEYNYYYYTSATDNKEPSSWKSANKSINSSDPDDNVPDVEYCLENTQTKEFNYHAYTTQVLLRAKFLPKAYQLPDLSTTNVQETDNDWIAINGGFYTYATLMEWIENEMITKYNKTDPTSYNGVLTTYFNDYIAAIGENRVTIPPTLSLATAAAQAAAIRGAFELLESKVKAKGAFSDGTVNYYSGAVNYYKIMIKHDDSDQANNEFGEFGVVRNSVYDIKVSKFINPGYPTIPDPDPITPDEADSFLALEITVNPWTWYTQTVEL